MNIDYKKLTVFNYQVVYYIFRLFTIAWIVQQIQYFKINSLRDKEFYEPSLWISKILFNEYPSNTTYITICIISTITILYSLYKPNIISNIIIFATVFILNLPVANYMGLGHHSHLVVLFYFFTLFLLPNNVNRNDYKYVQYVNLGLLITYSIAGLWKIGSIIKNSIFPTNEIIWTDLNAAKINSVYNYYIADQTIPNWMSQLYAYQYLWVGITLLGVLLQALCFLGAFNRKYLTFTMIFLVSFHFYTQYFVFADWKIVKYGVIVLFFPYHYLYNFLKKNRFIKFI